MKYLFLTSLLWWPQISQALVSCSPTSCSPACDSACTYYTCTQAATNSITINELPYTYVTKADACQDDLNGQVINQITNSAIPGLSSIPATVGTPYKQCETKTNSGPPCPPPPPPAGP